MPWTYYRSTDASAPALTGTAGSLITLLDAILVNGYGSKPAAGWSKAFTGTNRAAYRMGAGRTRAYLRVRDDAGGTAGAKEALVRMFETMTDVDNGTNPMPKAGQTAITDTSFVLRKSSAADSNARAWAAVADSRTLLIFTDHGSGNTWCPHYFGEFYSFLPSDAYGYGIFARYSENTAGDAGASGGGNCASGQGVTGLSGNLIARDYSGTNLAIQPDKVWGIGLHTNSGNGNFTGIAPFPNPVDGGLILSEVFLRTGEFSTHNLRGKLRGVWATPSSHTVMPFAAFDTVSGTGSLAGKTFAWVPNVYGTSTSGHLFIEISDTVPATP